jgi:hypothetical protein
MGLVEGSPHENVFERRIELRTSSVLDWRDNQLHHPNSCGTRRANNANDRIRANGLVLVVNSSTLPCEYLEGFTRGPTERTIPHVWVQEQERYVLA